MSDILYNGNSEGFAEVCNGYIAYAKDIIAGRSFPDIRDGLKPVGRRCIYGASLIKDKSLIKCLTMVGEICKLHPHGDSSVYLALANMTDSNGSMNVPTFIGQGELGKVYSSGTPAAMRYPKVKLGPVANDYLEDLDACEFKMSEEGDGQEPVVLPVKFPAALVNGTSGMAISVSTMIPSFNLGEVLNLTQEYLKNGKMETIIAPDFPSGGILVRDDSELMKMMISGKGKIKIRAKVEIEGKHILVKEVPFGKTVESIIKSIDKGISAGEFPGIQSAEDSTGLNSTSLVDIKCKSLKVVDSVLMQLYQARILQTSISSNMLFVENGEPIITGVYGVIERWVAWRAEICKKKCRLILDSINSELPRLSYFMSLVQNDEWKNKFIDYIVNDSKAKGKEYLKELFPDISDDICNWISDRRLPAYNKGDSYAVKYNDLIKQKEKYEYNLANINEYIYNDIEQLKMSRVQYLSRKTEETYKDYRFSKVSNSEVEDDSVCVYTLYKDGFLVKARDEFFESNKEVQCVIHAQANSTLIGFDCFGRILRVFGNEIPFTKPGGNGEYLPKYFGAEGYEGYNIKYLGLLDGTKRMLVYRDGFVGFLDTSEWLGKKKIRVVQRGVDVNVYNSLVEVIEEKDYKDYLVVADDSGKRVRFGVAEIKNIREASRKSRAKVFSASNPDVRYVTTMSYMELIQFMEDPMHYADRLAPIGNREIYGDAAVIMKEGTYYEYSES